MPKIFQEFCTNYKQLMQKFLNEIETHLMTLPLPK
jgi:hypothetical protein